MRPKIVLQPDEDDDAKRSPSEPIVLEAWYPEVRNDARYFYVDCDHVFSVIPRNVGMKEIFVKCCFRDELKKRSSHLLDNLSSSLICTTGNFQVSSTGLEPMTSAPASQRSWIPIPLKIPENFQVHI